MSDNGEIAEYGYARRLFEALLEKHYPESIAAPLPDLMGVLTQIDNLTTGLTRQPPSDAAMREAIEAAIVQRSIEIIRGETIPEMGSVLTQYADVAFDAVAALTQGTPDGR